MFIYFGILIGTRTKFSHYLTYPRRSTIFGMRRENPRAWRTRLRIHIVNEDNPAIAGRDPGWYWLVFRRNQYAIKRIRGPYSSVDECVRSLAENARL